MCTCGNKMINIKKNKDCCYSWMYGDVSDDIGDDK